MSMEPAPRPFLTFLLLTVGLVVVLPLQFVGSAIFRPDSALVVQLVVVVHAGVCLALTMTAPRPQIAQFGFWLFTYVWLAMAPVAMLSEDTYPWGLRVDEATSFKASLLIEVGLIGYSAGAALVSLLPRALGRGFETTLLEREFVLGRVLVGGALSFALAAVLIPRLGGVGSFFTSREAARAAAASLAGGGGNAGRALVNWGLCVPAFAALLGFLYVNRAKGTPLQRMGWGLMLVPILLLNVVVNNPVSQPRYWFGTVFLTLVFTAPFLKTIYRLRICVVAIVLGALTLFPITDYFRTDQPHHAPLVLSGQFVNNPDYDAYQQIQGGLIMVDATGFQPRLALGSPLFWVPRAMWPGKPPDTGMLIGEFLGYKFTNLSSPLWIESYIWAGLPMTGLVFLLWGAVGAWLDRMFQRAPRGTGSVVFVLVPALGFFQIILLRGSLIQAMPALTLMLAVSLLMSRRRTSVRPREVSQGDAERRSGNDSERSLAWLR